MLYKELANKHIKLPSKGQVEIDAGDGVILVPLNEGKVFLNWLNDKGQMISTHTLRFSTRVERRIRIINAESKEITLLQISL
jgi:hypothetical protein